MILLFITIFRSIPWFESSEIGMLANHTGTNNLSSLTGIPELEGPAGDDVLHQHGVALHEDQLGHQADGEPLQLPDLHVHRAQLGVVAVRLLLCCFLVP